MGTAVSYLYRIHSELPEGFQASYCTLLSESSRSHGDLIHVKLLGRLAQETITVVAQTQGI